MEKEMSVNSIQAEINRLEGLKAKIEADHCLNNLDKFVEEVRNLLSGCGKGYRSGDYYAPTRYYSEIIGVKNIRVYELPVSFSSDEYHWVIEVKVTSPAGYLLPEKVDIDGMTYETRFHMSSNYESELDY